MQMRYENKRTMGERELLEGGDSIDMSPEMLFSQFYETMNNQPMTEEQEAYMTDKIEKIWGMENETC